MIEKILKKRLKLEMALVIVLSFEDLAMFSLFHSQKYMHIHSQKYIHIQWAFYCSVFEILVRCLVFEEIKLMQS